MLDNWLRPLNMEEIAEAPLDTVNFGEKIKRFEAEMPALQDVRLAIIGIGDEGADAVRKSLYRMSFPFGKLAAADLGNVRKADSSFILPLLQELMDSKICPVIIGSLPKLAQAQYKAHFANQPLVSVVAVDERVPFHPRLGELDGYYLNAVMNGKSKPFHFGVVGCQSHFVDDEHARHRTGDAGRRHGRFQPRRPEKCRGAGCAASIPQRLHLRGSLPTQPLRWHERQADLRRVLRLRA
jgi:formiminoglutamase